MIRKAIVLMAVLLAFSPLAPAAEQTREQRQQEIIKELRDLRESIDELTLRVQALEQKVDTMDVSSSGADDNFQQHGPDREALSKISLPDNPTKEQVREYVQKILAASQNQNTFSERDPQVAMLERVGPDNMDVLIDACGHSRSSTFDVEYAIVRLARPEHRDLILAALPRIPDLAKVVVRHGWAKDAEGTLIDGLETASDYLPSAWMQATAELRDPKAVQALKDYMVRGQNRSDAYDALLAMPHRGDLAPTVAAAWRAVRGKRSWQELQMARIAVPYGHVDALGYLIKQLNAGNTGGYFADPGELRSLILRYTPARGSAQDFADWFRKNKDNIVWDAQAKLYTVKKAAAPAPATP